MAEKQNKIGLLVIDFINEIVDQKGKLSGKGYADFIRRHGTLDKVEQLIEGVRKSNATIFGIKIGFSKDYQEQPEKSPLFGQAKKFGALKLGTWATEFHPKIALMEDDLVLVKHRVSAFYGTPLNLVLRNRGINQLLICGVATDLAVQSTVRDAHDLDYTVTVVSDCCVAATDEDHDHTLRLLAKVANIKSLSEISLEK